MKPTLLVAVILLSSVFPLKAGAQAMTGEQLQTKCKQAVHDGGTESPTWSGGFCQGFVEGVRTSQVMWEALQNVEKDYPRFHHCLPVEATNGQILQVVVKFLDDHPERLHEPANILVLEALHKAFPCSK